MYYIEKANDPGWYYESPGRFVNSWQKKKHMDLMSAEHVQFRLRAIDVETVIRPVPIPEEV